MNGIHILCISPVIVRMSICSLCPIAIATPPGHPSPRSSTECPARLFGQCSSLQSSWSYSDSCLRSSWPILFWPSPGRSAKEESYFTAVIALVHPTHRLSRIVQAEDQDTVLVLLFGKLVEPMDQRKHIVQPIAYYNLLLRNQYADKSCTDITAITLPNSPNQNQNKTDVNNKCSTCTHYDDVITIQQFETPLILFFMIFICFLCFLNIAPPPLLLLLLLVSLPARITSLSWQGPIQCVHSTRR